MNAYRTVSMVSVQAWCYRAWSHSMFAGGIALGLSVPLILVDYITIGAMFMALGAMFSGAATMASMIGRRFGE